MKPIETPSAICSTSNLGCAPFKTDFTNSIELQELTIPPIGPKESLKRGLPERKGVVRHTKSGDETAIKIKYSIGIILYLLLKYWQHLYCYLQSKKHLNQNKHLKKL